MRYMRKNKSQRHNVTPRLRSGQARSQVKKILITGNEAIGEAAVQAGCELYAGYPITPQNELTAYMARRMRDESRIFIQAESEIAAINMVFGASCVGKRCMTSSSSPGISLKQEGVSYLAGCQLPSVIVNVMRGGPGLGNIGPSQSDYFQATKGGGHGDYRVVVLAPGSVQECFDLTVLAFDLADAYRNPVMVLVDAFLGQMAEPIILRSQGHKVSAQASPKGTRSQVKKGWALTGAAGRVPNVIRSLFLKEGVLEEHNIRLQEKFSRMQKKEERFEAQDTKDADIIFVSYGVSFRIAKEVARILREGRFKVGLFRPISLWPYPYQALREVSRGKKAVFVFELSYGQMLEDVRLAVGESPPIYFYGRGGGEVFTEEELVNFVISKLKNESKV